MGAPGEAGLLEGLAILEQEGEETLTELAMRAVLTHGEGLDGLGFIGGEFHGLEMLDLRLDVVQIDHGGIKGAGAQLIHQQIASGRLRGGVFAHAVPEIHRLQHGLGEVAEGGLLRVADAHFDAFAGEIGEGVDAFGIAFGHGENDLRLGEQHGLGELLRHGRDEADVTGVIHIGILRVRGVAHRLHGGAEDAAAVESGCDADALASGELFEQALDGQAVHSAGVEDQIRPQGPGIALHRLEAMLRKGGGPFLGSVQVTSKAQRGGGILGGGQDGGGGVFFMRGKLRHLDGFELVVLRHGAVPDDRGIHAAQREICRHIHDGGFHHGGLRGKGIPLRAESFFRYFRDAGRLGIGEGELHLSGEQAFEVRDLLRIALGHGDDRPLLHETQFLTREVLLLRIGERSIVGGDEKIALFRHAELSEQRARAAKLKLNRCAGFFFIRRGDFLDRLFQASGTENRERGLRRWGRLGGEPEQDRGSGEAEQDEKLAHGVKRQRERGVKGDLPGSRDEERGTGWHSVRP